MINPKENRWCKVCNADISQRRANAVFCSAAHKTLFHNGLKDYNAEYHKNSTRRKELCRKYYYANHEESKRKLRQKQKSRLPQVAAYEGSRRALKLQRTPAWLTETDYERMENEYKLAALQAKITGVPWHVDHIYPLQGKLVSGLHVPNNLMAIVGSDNIAKSNKYSVL
jgi:hypothetical protein